MKFKELFKNNKVAFSLIFVSVLLGIVCLILYLAAGTNKFNMNLSSAAIVAFILFILLGFAQIGFGAMTGRAVAMITFAQYAVGLYAFGSYIVTQLNLISNVMYGIMNPGSGDGNTFSIAMILTVVSSLLIWVIALIAAILLYKKEQKTAIGKNSTGNA